MEAQEGKASRNKRLKREALLQSAYELFTGKGFSETTIADITNRAGVAKGTYYLYYSNKEEIRDHLIRIKAEEILRKAYEAMLETYGTYLKDVEETVVFFAGNILDQLAQDRVLLGFVRRNLVWGFLRRGVGQVEPFTPDTDRNLLEVLTQLFRDSPVKYRNPEAMLYMIVEFAGAACYDSIMEGEPLPIEKFRPYLLDGIRGIIHSQEIRE